MINTNSKEARRGFEQHALSHFDSADSLFGTILNVLDDRYVYTVYQAGRKMAEDGCFDCYYSDIRNTLKDILQETDEEADRYSNGEIAKLYNHKMGQACERLVSKMNNQFEFYIYDGVKISFLEVFKYNRTDDYKDFNIYNTLNDIKKVGANTSIDFGNGNVLFAKRIKK